MKKVTNDDFIKKVKNKYHNKYNYSLINYINNKTKVKIICPIHGEFEQRPDYLLKGNGCPKCTYQKMTYSFDDFIKKSNILHRNKYKYIKETFIDIHNPIKIICPIHGEFEQVVKNHLSGRSCNECKKEKIGKLKRNDNTFFIKKSNEIHNNKYDYSLTNYKNSKVKVKIICSKHGIFEQRPNDHLNGHGCHMCIKSIGEEKIESFFKDKNINYITNKTFEDCKNLRKLPFDFYLPKYNICIEYDGIQHFKSIKYFGGKQALLLQHKRDEIKTNYCKENNINLLRIKYDENIEEKLTNSGVF